MGFDVERAKQVLKAFNNDLAKAASFLLENMSTNTGQELKKKIEDLLKSAIEDQEPSELKQKKLEQAQNLMSKLSAEMPDDDEDYLDLNTDEDAFFINKYYSLL